MNIDPKYDQLDRIFNVGTGLSNLDERGLDNLSALLKEVDSLFERFSKRFTSSDLLAEDQRDHLSIVRLLNQMLAEEGVIYDHDHLSYSFFLCFLYAMTAAFKVWIEEGNDRELASFVFKDPLSKELIEEHLTKVLADLRIKENVYLYAYYLSSYVYQKFKIKYYTI